MVLFCFVGSLMIRGVEIVLFLFHFARCPNLSIALLFVTLVLDISRFYLFCHKLMTTVFVLPLIFNSAHLFIKSQIMFTFKFMGYGRMAFALLHEIMTFFPTLQSFLLTITQMYYILKFFSILCCLLKSICNFMSSFS